MKTSFRHGIIRHQFDTNQQQSFISYANGVGYLHGDDQPLLYTIADKNSDYLLIETGVIRAWESLPAAGTYYLYADINTIAAERTFGFTTIDPTSGIAPPSAPAVGQHWYDSTQNITKVWSGSAWNDRIRVFLAKLFNGVLVSMSANAPSFLGTTVGVNVATVVGTIILDSQKHPFLKSDNTFLTTEDEVYAQVVSQQQPYQTAIVNGVLIPNGSPVIHGIAQVPIVGGTIVVFQQFGKIVPGDPLVVEKGLFGYVEHDINVGDSAPLIIDGIITNLNWQWSPGSLNDPVYCGNNGVVVSSPLFPNQLPVGNITDIHSIVLRSRTKQVVNIPPSPASIYALGSVKLTTADPTTTAVSSTDPRLTDARTPTIHTHSSDDVTVGMDTLTNVLDDLETTKFDVAGGQLSGDLLLFSDPTQDTQASTKKYVDDQVGPVAQSLANHTHPDILATAASLYSLLTHDHDSRYSLILHTHSDYSLTTHTHDALYSSITHHHDSVYAALVHSHANYSLTTHDHNTLYSSITHSHTIAEVIGLQTALDEKLNLTGGSGGFYYQPSPPVSPVVGDRWVDTDDNILYTYVFDGTSYQWVEF